VVFPGPGDKSAGQLVVVCLWSACLPSRYLCVSEYPSFVVDSPPPSPPCSPHLCRHLCLALWIPVNPEKGKEVTEPTCFTVTARRGADQSRFRTMTMLCLDVALLSPGEARGAAALCAEGQSPCNEPLHEDLLRASARCETLEPITPPLLGRCEDRAVRWGE